jgi:hypothetical protein
MTAQTTTLADFIRQSATIFSEGKARAMALPPNTVQVWPGGAVFTSIQAAIDSVSGAGPQLQYQVSVGPGTYNENIQMVDYVYVTGAEQSLTFITAPAQEASPIRGVVNTASGGGISDLTINAPGGAWGVWPVGIQICGSGKFHISGVTINSGDSGAVGNNVRGICNNTGSYSGNLILGSSILNIQGGSDSTVIGIELDGWNGVASPVLLVNLTSISASSQSQSFGVSTAIGASVTLEDSKITGGTWALYNSDGISPITANQCTIDGPVSTGVTVNN